MMKKILKNKNLVTILGLVVLVIILFVFYSKRVNDAIEPITVPYAKKEIAAGTQITEDKVGTAIIPQAMVSEDIVSNLSGVIGKYASSDTIIPEGSLFYTRSVVEKEALPANIILDVKEGEVLYYMEVNTKTTYGNAIYPGNYIDIYLKAATSSLENTKVDSYNSKVLLGKILSNVRVIAVKDSFGEPVFEELEEGRTPAIIVFAVPEEYYILLKKSEYLRTYSSELIPVPTNEGLKNNPGELQLSSETLKKWINDITVWTAM